MNRNKTLDSTVLVLAVIGSLIFLNVVGLGLFGRLDFTRDKQFTLSAATKDTLKQLKDPVTVRAYFTDDLPPPYSSNARYVKDLLDEYFNHAGGKLRYEFIDPAAAETSEDKQKKKDVKHDIFGRAVRERTSIEQELESLGIPPVQVAVFKDDKREIIRAYMGLSVALGEDKEAIPVVQDTTSLEYDLTTLIRKLSRERTPKVAVAMGQEGPNPQEGLGQMWGLLGQLYEVVPVDLQNSAVIDDDVDALIVLGPKEPLMDTAKRAIDDFVMAGKPVAFLVDNVKAKLQTGQAEPANSGLQDLLASYGVQVKDGLVLDKLCATINTIQQRGHLRIQQPVMYPFIPLVENQDPNNKLTRGIPEVPFPFVAPLEVIGLEGVQAEVLVSSSKDSWVQAPPYNLDPSQRWTLDRIQSQQSHPLVVSLSGAIPTAFGQLDESGQPMRAHNGRILVAGGASFVMDDFMSRPSQALVLNLVDWLLLDDAMLAMRSRGLGAAPLDELSDGTKSAVKYFNMAGVPIGFVGFGLAWWRRRENKRRTVTI